MLKLSLSGFRAQRSVSFLTWKWDDEMVKFCCTTTFICLCAGFVFLTTVRRMKIVLRFSPQFTRHIRYMMSTFKCYSLLSYDKLKLIQFQWVCTPIFLNVQPRWGRRNKSKLNCLVMECWWAGREEYLRAYQKSLPYYKQPKTWCCILARGDPRVLIHFSVRMLRVSTAATVCWESVKMHA